MLEYYSGRPPMAWAKLLDHDRAVAQEGMDWSRRLFQGLVNAEKLALLDCWTATFLKNLVWPQV